MFSSFVTVKSCRIWPALVLLLIPCTVASDESSLLDGWYDVWFFRFLINVLGYSTIIVPGYLLICYFKRINYLETGWLKPWHPGHYLGLLSVNSIHCFPPLFAFIAGSGICFPVIKSCVFGSEAKAGLLDDVPVAPRNEGDSGSSARHYFKLIFCAAGLQVRSSH